MNDDGDTKDDVRMPDGEIGEKINKLFKIDEKDTSKPAPTPRTRSRCLHARYGPHTNQHTQMLLFSPPWAKKPPLRPRRLLARLKRPGSSPARCMALLNACHQFIWQVSE